MSTLKVNNLTDLGADAVVTNGVIAASALPTGSILQVVSTTKTDTFSTSSTSYTDITGASLTITPSSASSKIYVSFDTVAGVSGGDTINFALLRDSTSIGDGAPAGSRLAAISKLYLGSAGLTGTANGQFLDSPATTSAIIYKLQIRAGGSTVYIGRDSADADNTGTQYARTPLTITAMEVAG